MRANSTHAQDTQDSAPLAPTLESTPTATPRSPIADVAVEYVATKYGIAPEKLYVGDEEPMEFPLLGRKSTYITLVYVQTDATTLYSLLVEPDTKAIEEDVNAVLAAERAAYTAKYGKLAPALYDRLQTIGDKDTLPIAIWVEHNEKERTQEELEAELVQLYPEAGQALKESGILWAVKDADLRTAINKNI